MFTTTTPTPTVPGNTTHLNLYQPTPTGRLVPVTTGYLYNQYNPTPGVVPMYVQYLGNVYGLVTLPSYPGNTYTMLPPGSNQHPNHPTYVLL